jgi:hypothetical protein
VSRWEVEQRGEIMVKLRLRLLGSGLLVAALGGMLFAAKTETLTGTVGDMMCGAKHMGDDAKACTLGCVEHGSDYALVVGDKVYRLKGKTEGLKDYAGKEATVTGTVNGDTVEVASVSTPMK